MPPRGRLPSERDSKVCAVCGRSFSWRKRWEKVWDAVRYCSDACRRRRQQATHRG